MKAIAIALAVTQACAISLKVTSGDGNTSSPYLYGAMFEEMDHSGDGGIHGQLLQNNGFQGENPGLTAYTSVGAVDISRDTDTPVSHAITSSLKLSMRDDANGYVGFANNGYGGVPVQSATYRTSFWMQGAYSGAVTVQLVGSQSGRVFAEHNVSVKSVEDRFQRFEGRLESEAAPDGKNEWRLLVDAGLVTSGTVHVGLIELFPPTYHNRTNGLRDDVASFLESSNPAFLRFPGGNNIEGLSIPQRWIWNQTIGPVVERPGRQGDWFYPNTDALGLDEFMWWCEDMNMTAMLAVWAGKSYGRIVSGDELQPYVDDIMNELEYLLGSANSTTWGRKRAQNGRVEPYDLKFVEIGNEDYLTGGCPTYPQRFMQIYEAIHAVYPQLTLIASTEVEDCLPSPLPDSVMVDVHYYNQADRLVSNFDQYDNYARDRDVVVGEWGCRNTTAERGQFWSTMQCSCAEAAHMIGFERNSDVVKMTTYAPLLQNFAFTQWSPTLFGLDSSPDSLTASTSFFVQKMFAENRGHTTLPMYSSVNFGPLYWVATRNDTNMQTKLVNYGEDSHSLNISMPNTRSGKLLMISGGQYQGNTPHNVGIVPSSQDVQSSADDGGVYEVEMPPWSVAVLAADYDAGLSDVYESGSSILSPRWLLVTVVVGIVSYLI